jgi:hypothetical protein
VLPEEISYALRQLCKRPSLTIIAILTLALGIGGSTEAFTVVDSVLLKPLSYRNSGQLVVLWERVDFLGSGYLWTQPAACGDVAGSRRGVQRPVIAA